MTQYLSAESVLAIAFVRSGMHTLLLDSVRSYGYRLAVALNSTTEDRWVFQWGSRYLDGVVSPFLEIDEDTATLTTDVMGLGKVLDSLPNDVLETAEQVEWTE